MLNFDENKCLFTSRELCLEQAVAQRCSPEKVFLETSQNSQENTCARVSFLMKACNFIKKRPWDRCLPVNFAKFIETYRKLTFSLKFQIFKRKLLLFSVTVWLTFCQNYMTHLFKRYIDKIVCLVSQGVSGFLLFILTQMFWRNKISSLKKKLKNLRKHHFKEENMMFWIIRNYLCEISLKANVATDEGNGRNEMWILNNEMK